MKEGKMEQIPVRARPDNADSSGSENLDSYIPSPEQQERATILKKLVTNLERAGVRYSIAGGYGLDGLYGKLTRDHNDIDIQSLPEDAEVVRKLIRGAGFQLDGIKIRNDLEEYIHDRTGTKLEYHPDPFGQHRTEVEAQEFMPVLPNASIDSVSFKSPTSKGHEEIARIQTVRAKEGQWDPYPHEQWRSVIMNAIKKRSEES